MLICRARPAPLDLLLAGLKKSPKAARDWVTMSIIEPCREGGDPTSEKNEVFLLAPP